MAWEELLKKGMATHSSILGASLVAQTVNKESAWNVEDLGSVIVFIGLFQLYQRHFSHSNLRECYQINLGVGEILNLDLCLSVYLAFFFFSLLIFKIWIL